LLEVGHGGNKFARNAEQPLTCDVLVVDESSMIDLELADAVLQAVPLAARVIFVGDADQLPSVGPGAVLLELIESGVVPVVRLSEVFRQAGQSGIVECSHRILAGELPETKQQGDFFVIRTASHERCLSTVEELVTRRIPQRFGMHPMRDIQVLCPMHRGSVGTTHINQMLQRVLNPQATGLKVGETEFFVRDKVIQLKNDYDRQVFNGDVGEIETLDPETHSLDVCFASEDGPRVIKYERSHLAQLQLAYCLSVHKSQGSEYPAVVVVLLKSHFLMLSRNLLYTAVTRARRLCVLVTDDRALQIALSETRREVRATGLAERLKIAVSAPA
jgi:exodeoxyribonuclease V alpha subunit